MNKNIWIILNLILSFVILIILGCSNDNQAIQPRIIDNSIKIISISPDTVIIGGTIELVGENFGEQQDSNYVLFNDIVASNYLLWTDTLIKVIVPIRSITGKVSVWVNGKSSNKEDYFIKEESGYDSVKIGTQVWMLKNLDVSTYRNGDLIPEVRDSLEWSKLKTGAWCYYNNDPILGAIYGKLYNWFAINDSRGLAPVGWRIPTNSGWQELSNYLGGNYLAGGKMKESDTIHWTKPNIGATNESGFTGLPGGFRDKIFSFMAIGLNGGWWSTKETNTIQAYYRELGYYENAFLGMNIYKVNGLSVRCVKDSI